MIILYIKLADMAKNDKRRQQQSDAEMDLASRKKQYFYKDSASHWVFPNKL